MYGATDSPGSGSVTTLTNTKLPMSLIVESKTSCGISPPDETCPSIFRRRYSRSLIKTAISLSVNLRSLSRCSTKFLDRPSNCDRYSALIHSCSEIWI